MQCKQCMPPQCTLVALVHPPYGWCNPPSTLSNMWHHCPRAVWVPDFKEVRARVIYCRVYYCRVYTGVYTVLL